MDNDPFGGDNGLGVRVVKGLALAAVMAIVAFALIGSGAAMATTICKEATKKSAEECAAPYPGEFEFKAGLQTGKSAEFTAGAIAVKCSGSTLNGFVSKNPAEGQIPGQVKALTFAGCTAGGFGCTVGALNLPYGAQVSALAEPLGNGILRFAEEKGPPGVTISCAFLLPVTCSFEFQGSAELKIEGGTPAKIAAEKVPLKLLEGPKVCGEEPRWSAPYEITEAAGTKKPAFFVVPSP